MKRQNEPQDHIVNPAALAKTIRKAPFRLVDYLVTGKNGERKIPSEARFREEARAVNVGNSAGHTHYRDAHMDEVRQTLAEHQGHEARAEEAEPRRDIALQLYTACAIVVTALRVLPLNSIDPVRKRLNGVAKVLLIIGDTCVLGDQVYRASTPIWLALLLGLSLATSVVAIGAKCGHDIAAADQRKDRGLAPGALHPAALVIVSPLYDDGTADERHRFWLRLAYMAAGVMFLALFFISDGSGDSAKLAMGYGLLGALTVAGSAASEAYATNDADEQRRLAEHRMTGAADALDEFEQLEYTSAFTGSFATGTENAIRHGAVAAAGAVTVEANRVDDSPEIGGYIDGGHIPVVPTPPVPSEFVPPVRSERRSKPRPKIDLLGDIFTGSWTIDTGAKDTSAIGAEGLFTSWFDETLGPDGSKQPQFREEIATRPP